jgi:predicted adenine nucleotide alpha hydrolase (AANH) superfamily ATPase
MRVLLHICCGPCAIYPVEILRQEGHEVYGYFFNPNIHPYREYTRRLETLEQYARSIDLPLIVSDDYDLEGFLREAVFRETERCRFCYRLRLEQAAYVARKGKFDAISTTLLYSRFQKHDLIADTGREAAGARNLDFFYRDFREGWRQGILRSRELGMYRQQYCGCVYSEKERYYKPIKKPGKNRTAQGS